MSKIEDRDLASWLKKEHEQVEKLADNLFACVAIIPRAVSQDWISGLRERFEHFRAHLLMHMTLEEKEGYMQAVLERRPTLSNKVDKLEQEHRDLELLLNDLHKLAEELEPKRTLIIRDFCKRVQLLLGYVEHHEDEENDFVEFVFTDDIGTKD